MEDMTPQQTPRPPSGPRPAREAAKAPVDGRLALPSRRGAARRLRAAAPAAAAPRARARAAGDAPRPRSSARALRRARARSPPPSRRARLLQGDDPEPLPERAGRAHAAPRPDAHQRDLRQREPGRRLRAHGTGHRHRLPDRPRRHARHQRARRRRRRATSPCASGPTAASIDAQVLGTDPSSDLAVLKISRRRHAQRRAARLRGLQPRARRRPRGRHRQPARPGPHRHGGHRLRPRPRDPRAQRLPDRRGHPDRRADQPRQLRRPAARRRRPRDRRQLADRHRRRRAATSASASRCPSNTVRQVVPRLQQRPDHRAPVPRRVAPARPRPPAAAAPSSARSSPAARPSAAACRSTT